ncbi:MAG: two-component system regulatory protein YycI, partial [Lysinibacillus sp.]
VFLYYHYLRVYNEAQRVELLSEKKIESILNDENITYKNLPSTIIEAPYILGKVKTYSLSELPSIQSVSYKLVTENQLQATISKPISLGSDITTLKLNEFLQQFVYEGAQFKLWEINEETRTATFFQQVNDHTLYYNMSGYVKIHWNVDNEVFMYEQSMLEKVEPKEQKKKIIAPLQIIDELYTENLLKTGAEIVDMNLGYSSLLQITQTQLFTPTWEVRVKTDGEEQTFFVNAVDLKVIEFNEQPLQEEEELGENNNAI